MRIAIGCDHTGLEYKTAIIGHLEKAGVECVDMGTYDSASCDYPDYAGKVCREVTGGRAALGILICGTGIGVSIAANKHRGIRAALCHEAYSARLTRLHNDANVLALGARVTGIELALDIVDTFVFTAFSGDERHMRRIAKIAGIERQCDKN